MHPNLKIKNKKYYISATDYWNAISFSLFDRAKADVPAFTQHPLFWAWQLTLASYYPSSTVHLLIFLKESESAVCKKENNKKKDTQKAFIAVIAQTPYLHALFSHP